MEPPQTYEGAVGLNFFTEDRLVRSLAAELFAGREGEAALRRLEEFGALCGGRLARLVEAAHAEERLPRLQGYDRWGARVDRVVYCPEQLEARRLALAAGVLPPAGWAERLLKAYLLNQNGEGGVTCPLAMTDGLIQLLEAHGTPSQKARWLPLLRDPQTQTPLTGGQFVTERHGGSNVSENECSARRAADGSWRLTGLKWFCSNPGELWVTTAKPEGSSRVALFVMPKRLPDGALNACHILRLKDLSGTRGKATAEVEYRGAAAELVGRPGAGLSLLLDPVLRTSRIHVGAASLGMARRALLEAELFCSRRVVLGRPATELPAVARELESMRRAFARGARAFFALLRALESADPAAEVLIPLLKIELSRLGVDLVRRARLLLAGNGALRDFSPLPRLAEDAVIQEIWEGTHPILSLHAAKALRRTRSRAAFERLTARPFAAADGAEPEALCAAAWESLASSR